MAALEDLVLTQILQAQSLAEPIRVGLSEDHFLSPEPKAVYGFMRGHWFHPATSGTLPSVDRIRSRWPSFSPLDLEGKDYPALRAAIDELKMRSLKLDAVAMADYFQELAEEDPVNAVKVMKSSVIELELKMNTGEECRGAGLGEILSLAEEHYTGAQTGAIYGVPWPWRCLTEDTLGKRGGDFTILYGRMKSMKTWVLLYCAAMDFLEHNRRVLVWSREMSELKLGLRMAALLARVDYQLFKKGLLPPRLCEKAFSILRGLVRGNAKIDIRRGASQGTRDILLLAGRKAPKNLEGLKQKIHEFEPDVVYLDSFYHLDTPKSEKMTVRWQRVACLGEDVKSYAEDDNLPITAVHQANRLGEKTYGNTLADMADADALAREADTVIRILKSPGNIRLNEVEYEQELIEAVQLMKAQLKSVKRKTRAPRIDLDGGKHDANRILMERLAKQLNEDRYGSSLALVMGGNREGVLQAFTINATPAYNFELIDDKPDMADIRNWMKEDDKAEDDGPPKRAKPKGENRVSPAKFEESLPDGS